MSKNIKNLIDNVEEQSKTRVELEQTIEKLREDIEKLKSKIQEEEILRQVGNSDTKDKDIIPDEVQILKDMIVTQRTDLVQKEQEIEILKKKIDETQNSNEQNTQSMSNNSEELISQLRVENETYKINENDAKSLIEQLLEENENYRTEIRTLKIQLNKLEPKPSKHEKSQDIMLKDVKLEKPKSNKKKSKAQEIDLDQDLKEENLENLENLKHENISIAIKNIDTSGIGSTKKFEKTLEETKAMEEELKNLSESFITEHFEKDEQSFTDIKALKEEFRDLSDKPSVDLANQFSEIQTKKQIVTVDTSSGRRKCPQCGNNNKAFIYESVDKTNILMASPRMYGKKYKCGKCAFEWRLKEIQ